MELILLIVIAVLMIVLLVLSLTKGNNQTQAEQLQIALRQQMQENREELNRSIRELRMEMTQTLNQNMQQLQDVLHKNMMTTGELQRQKFDMMARQQEALLKSTEKRLDDMRLMVEEKLQKTLNERIGQSFEIVRSQLENVQKGLGEMKSLAQDVGGLKKVLSKEKDIIRRETRCIVDKCFELGEGDLAVGSVRAVLAGVLDIPFAPSRYNAGKMLPARDNDGAIRILDMGALPFTDDIKAFHRAKIEERAKAEKRNATFQMVIDDVYAISKGRLVGRPQALRR